MITTTLGFEAGFLTPELITRIGRNVIRFQPHSLRVGKKSSPFRGWDDLEKRISESDLRFDLTSLDGTCDFGFSDQGDWRFCTVHWCQVDFEESESSFIESLVGPKFHSGFSGDESTLTLDDSEEGEPKPPGRQVMYPGMWLAAGWRNWWGPWAFTQLDRNRIQNFSPTYRTQGLPHGGLSLALTESPYDPGLAEIQARFWLETGLAELEEKSYQVLEQQMSSVAVAGVHNEEEVKVADSVVVDASAAAHWIASALNSSGYAVDFTVESLRELDRFFDEQTIKGEAKPGGLLAEDLGAKLFALGSYVGEVLRKAYGGDWNADDGGEMNIQVVFHGGGTVWPVQKVIKRFQNGPEDALFAYGSALARYTQQAL